MWAGPQRLPAAEEERPLPENSLRAPHPQLCTGRELPLTLPNLAWLGRRERFSFQIRFHCANTWQRGPGPVLLPHRGCCSPGWVDPNTGTPPPAHLGSRPGS